MFAFLKKSLFRAKLKLGLLKYKLQANKTYFQLFCFINIDIFSLTLQIPKCKFKFCFILNFRNVNYVRNAVIIYFKITVHSKLDMKLVCTH